MVLLLTILGFKKNIMKKNNELEELAKILAVNHVDVSLRLHEEGNPFSKIMSSKIDRSAFPRSRNILIVGAGASKAANDNLNTAEKVAAELEKKLVGDNEELRDLLNEEILRLSNIYNLEPKSFETKLLAFTKFFPKKVRSEIGQFFHSDFKFFPNLFYEVVAHLFKHRFIDVIISFNFDELLDQIILEEMADSEYHYIYSDGHCPVNEDLVTDHRFKKPIYIKPHGTASHPSTLRFTREAYEELPHNIYELITYLVSGKTNIEEQGLEHIPVNLISAGFAMESFEFNQILASNLDKGTKFYHINLDKFESNNSALNKNLSIRTTKVTKKLTLDHIAKYLWEYTAASFIDIYQPKGIDRHLMVNLLFESERHRSRSPNETAAYAKDRLLFEIFVSIINNKGLISLEHLVTGRAGIYFNLLKSIDDNSKGFHHYMQLMGLTKYKGHVETTYVLEDSQCERFNFESILNFSYSRLCEAMSPKRKEALGRPGTLKKFKSYCKKIYYSNLKNLTPRFKNPHFELFNGIKNHHVINTNLLWSYKFRELLQRKKSWDVIMVISESGGVLLNEFNKSFLANKKIFLITANERIQQKFDGINIVGGIPKVLPWWIHNRHMVLFIKEKSSKKVKHWKDKWDLYRGIYYTSIFSNRVNPVYIKEQDDKEIMLGIFGRYWFRATSYDEDLNPSIRITKSWEEIDNSLNDLANME